MTRYSDRKYFYLIVVLFMNATILVDLVKNIAVAFMPALANYAEIIRNILYIGCFLYVIYLFVADGMTRQDVFLIFGIVLAFTISVIIETKTLGIMKTGVLLFVSRVLTGYFLLEHVDDFGRLAEAQVKLLPVALLYSFFAIFQVRTNYMTMSYNLMPIALIYVFYGLRKGKRVVLLSGLFGLTIAVIYGSRGAFVGAAVALVLYAIILFLRRESKLTWGKLLLGTTALVGAILIIVFWEEVISLLLQFFKGSRTLRLILNGGFTLNTGRERLYQTIRREISNELFIPHGIFADRIVVAQSKGQVATYYTYPHNIVYEIIYQFGLVFGGAFLLLIAGYLIRFAVKSKKMDPMKLIVAIPYIAISMTQLMVSSSYLNSFLWGIAMGVVVNRNNHMATVNLEESISN